jgi:hypothetical protein
MQKSWRAISSLIRLLVRGHTFIVIGSVLALGMGYSWLARESQSLLANLLSLGVWGPEQLANLVMDAGLASWLMQKAS